MENNKLIAEALLEIAKRSTTTFLEVGQEDNELVEAAKKFNLIIPSPDLMIMKTVYAEIDKVNLNGVVLPRKAVKEGLNTLIGKQCNWEHNGEGYVCGFTISAKINEDEIETINVLFKSLFPDQTDELKEKVKSGEAAVSFEIWNINPETKKSVVKDLDNGFKEISPIIFHGTGVLLAHKPACPKAKIFQLVAKKEIEDAEKITYKVFSEDLIYAQLAIEESKCVNCGTCKCTKEKEELKVDLEAKEKLCAECKQPLKDGEKDLCAECLKKKEKATEEQKTEGTPIETQTPATEAVVTETKIEAPKVDVVPEAKAQDVETIVPKIVTKVTRIYSDLFVDTFVEGTMSGTSEGKSSSTKITEYQDGTKDEVTSESQYKQKFDLAEVEEKINAAKSEKDTEIAILKAEQEKSLVEKDKEIINLKQELGTKDQEIAELKTPKVIEKKEKSMTVGAVEGDKNSEVKRQAENINKIIANKGK